jgi:hypothetical protein
MRWGLFLALVATLSGSSPHSRILDSFLPLNGVTIQLDDLRHSNVTEAAFNRLLDQVDAVYGPIFQSAGRKLVIKRDWTAPVFNAFAQFDEAGNPEILMFGGLARGEGMTPDAMIIVACHEIGHHLGGAPTETGVFFGKPGVMSVEGEADYFATLKCARRVFAAYDDETWIAKELVDPATIAICYEQFKDPNQVKICARSIAAGARLFAAMENASAVLPVPASALNLVTDLSVTTEWWHPDPQCRISTMVAGAICQRSVDENMSSIDPTAGACTIRNQPLGARPPCWYGVQGEAIDYVTPDVKNALDRLKANLPPWIR